MFRSLDGDISVGRLGTVRFPPGWYTYVGSAFGPGGLKGRLTHHLKPLKTCHWHVDYLRRQACVRQVWISTAAQRLEHFWALRLAGLPSARRALKGFGCSDCSCTSHLARFDKHPGARFLSSILGARLALGSVQE